MKLLKIGVVAIFLATITLPVFAEDYIGIGIGFQKYEFFTKDNVKFGEYFMIVYVAPGSPAEQAGIQKNDILISINGRSVYPMNEEKIINNIRGPIGTDIVIKISRVEVDKKGYSQPPIEKEFTIKRQKISMGLKKEEK